MESVTPRKRWNRRGIELPDGWEQAYLDGIRSHGGRYLAAEQAGVSYRTALRRREVDPDFAEAVEDATQTLVDEWQSELHEVGRGDRKGNPLPYFGLLKAHRPDQWMERSLVASLNVDLSVQDATASQAAMLLSGMLGRLTGATVRSLEAAARSDAVIDVTPSNAANRIGDTSAAPQERALPAAPGELADGPEPRQSTE